MNGWDMFPLSLSSVVTITIVSQLLAATIADHLSYDQLENWRGRLRPRPWEQDGAVYQKWCRVKAWKPLIPDAGITSPYKFRKKHLQGIEKDYIHQFILESVRAELTHELTIILAIPIILACPTQFVRWLIAYSLLMNLPCTIIQRYNRPRFERILKGRSKGDAKGSREPITQPSLAVYEKRPKRKFFRP